MNGTVDVLVKWATLPRRTASAHQSRQGVPPGAQGAPGQGGKGAHVDEMMEDSDTMSPIVDEESRQHRINLMRSSQKAGEFVRSLQAQAGGCRAGKVAGPGAGRRMGQGRGECG